MLNQVKIIRLVWADYTFALTLPDGYFKPPPK